MGALPIYGQGIWDTSSAPNTKGPGGGNPNIGKNVLSLVGSNATNVSDFHGGSAAGSSGSGSSSSAGLSPDQGSGAPNKPSPDASMLNTVRGGLSPDQGNGGPNKPSPDANMLNTLGSKSAGSSPRAPYLGGTEKGVQIQ